MYYLKNLLSSSNRHNIKLNNILPNVKIHFLSIILVKNPPAQLSE